VPMHSFRCPTGHVFDAYQPVDQLDSTMACAHCKAMAEKVFLRAPMAIVRQDVRYTSPLDGRPITNYQEHLNDLARGDCVAYEPGIKQDQERIARESETAVERSIETTIEREIALMPAQKREKLTAELQGGLTAEPTRITPPQKSFKGQ
jgi:hypothetical protein